MQALGLYRYTRATPRRVLASAWALRTLSAVYAEFLPEFALLTIQPFAQGQIQYLTAVKYRPGRLLPTPQSRDPRLRHGKTRNQGSIQISEAQIPAWEVVPRALPVTRKCSFPFCDDDTSPLPLPLSHGELTQLSLNQQVPSLQPLSTFIHTPTPRRYSKYSSPHLRTKTSCILNTHTLSRQPPWILVPTRDPDV